jgi:cyclic beta-1,2-glucan synthetase
LNQFAGVVKARGDLVSATALRQRADSLRDAVEAQGWDGSWYRRAFFDDGTPLGSVQNDACQIDSIAQSWAVLSRVADPERARLAMDALAARLVDREGRLILLFAPPFDDEPLDPGYIKGYLPGIRENGGQYTHAAAWVVQAVCLLGQGRRGLELLEMLNPIRHAEDSKAVEVYKVEPYVLAGDVYSHPPHVGRGGWTWYTGSAGWLYRTILESILGLHRHGNRLLIAPCIPGAWPGFEIVYRVQSSTYRIVVQNPHGVEVSPVSVWLDDQHLGEPIIPLADDGRSHEVRIVITPAPSSQVETSAPDK